MAFQEVTLGLRDFECGEDRQRSEVGNRWAAEKLVLCQMLGQSEVCGVAEGCINVKHG